MSTICPNALFLSESPHEEFATDNFRSRAVLSSLLGGFATNGVHVALMHPRSKTGATPPPPPSPPFILCLFTALCRRLTLRRAATCFATTARGWLARWTHDTPVHGVENILQHRVDGLSRADIPRGGGALVVVFLGLCVQVARLQYRRRTVRHCCALLSPINHGAKQNSAFSLVERVYGCAAWVVSTAGVLLPRGCRRREGG